MLREHLSQEHDRASRRLETIDRQVVWIHETALGASAGRLLDLGCGPGLYTARLARLGHRCVGIDISPAAVAHARAEAEREGIDCEYRLQDLRAGGFGASFDAALLISGELNTFPPGEALHLLTGTRRALARGGVLVLEVHSERFVRSLGEARTSWYTASRGVFSDQPHLCLRKCFWDAERSAAIERFTIVDAAGRLAVHLCTTQAYSEAGYSSLLSSAGFAREERHASLSGEPGPRRDGLQVLIARA